jgi:hypothetical protein
MKKKVLLAVVLSLLAITLLSGCAGDNSQTIPAGDLPSSVATEAPDDIVFTPGGYAYRANVHQEGVPDKWPPVETVQVTLDDINIDYRDSIETRAGETRNNILFIWHENGFQDTELDVYTEDLPDELEISQNYGGGRPGILLRTLVIVISSGVTPGQYAFQIGIIVGGRDYGTIPCTVNVVE